MREKQNLSNEKGYSPLSALIFFNLIHRSLNMEHQHNSMAETSVGTFSFSCALELLKNGSRVARKGWNGKGMFVLLIKGNAVTESINACYGDSNNKINVLVLDALYMYTATKELVPWLASQTDLLADDWYIV